MNSWNNSSVALLTFRRWCLVICAIILVWPVQVIHDVRTRILHASPTILAHAMADFNNHMELFDNIGSWALDDESNNFTSWRYSVRYACGTRCSGRALVMLHEELPAGGREGLTHDHSAKLLRLYITHEQCHSIPLLPWPRHCKEWVVWAEMRAIDGGDGDGGGGGGTEYWERAAQCCARVAMLMRSCGPAALSKLQARRVNSLPTLIE